MRTNNKQLILSTELGTVLGSIFCCFYICVCIPLLAVD